ncbi:NAD(P)/FAD-dependent oxidoreductase [Arenibaculum pallidiluteum]|uniref:NAD(P)/FAD-dependent oxidoreductase n=1 Tax=Arenibaculum pallidiluteum TaxID=2812559 RepID=UPI001F215716|nr:NAD(P)-binding protein [Arenibaculum pallidiluteum]
MAGSAAASGGSVAVVGAGIAGLACAGLLAGAGHHVVVFDKGRGPGGRMATRRMGEVRFDHGAQYFTARDPRFAAAVQEWIREGAAAPWQGRVVRLAARPGPAGEPGVAPAEEPGEHFAGVPGEHFAGVPGEHFAGVPGERFVGVPGMTAPARRMAEGLDLRSGVRVKAARHGAGGWTLLGEHGPLGAFAALVVAVPAPQAVPLLADSPRLREAAAGVAMAPCWSAMVRLDRRLAPGFDAALIESPDPAFPLSWVARDGSKPGRPEDGGGDAWVLHATPAWSEANLEREAGEVLPLLAEAFRTLLGTGGAGFAVVEGQAHRWRYARPVAPHGPGLLLDGELGLGACGDWCAEARVEAAWLSGRALAEAMLR